MDSGEINPQSPWFKYCGERGYCYNSKTSLRSSGSDCRSLRRRRCLTGSGLGCIHGAEGARPAAPGAARLAAGAASVRCSLSRSGAPHRALELRVWPAPCPSSVVLAAPGYVRCLLANPFVLREGRVSSYTSVFDTLALRPGFAATARRANGHGSEVARPCGSRMAAELELQQHREPERGGAGGGTKAGATTGTRATAASWLWPCPSPAAASICFFARLRIKKDESAKSSRRGRKRHATQVVIVTTKQ